MGELLNNSEPLKATDGLPTSESIKEITIAMSSDDASNLNGEVVVKKGYPRGNNISRVYSNNEFQKMATSQYISGIKTAMKLAGFTEYQHSKGDDHKVMLDSFGEWVANQKAMVSELTLNLESEISARKKASSDVELFELREFARKSGINEDYIDFSIYEVKKRYKNYLEEQELIKSSRDNSDKNENAENNEETEELSIMDIFAEFATDNRHLRKTNSYIKTGKSIKKEPVKNFSYVERLHKARNEGDIQLVSRLKSEAAKNGVFLR